MDDKPETDIEYTLDYRDVKHPRLEFKTGSLLIILPKSYKNEKETLEKYRQWIRRKQNDIRKALQEAQAKSINRTRTDKDLRQLIEKLAREYQTELQTRINKIYYKKMKTKWASYSGNGNLTINTLIKYLPENMIQYITYHEIAHSKERRHNERFWGIVSRKFPEWQTKEKDLFTYWFMIQEKT